MNDELHQRKNDHIELSLRDDSQGFVRPFSEHRLPYKALPNINLEDVDTSTVLLGKQLSQPLIIGAMTGGTKWAKTINTNLSIAAEKCKVALCVGSQRIALEFPDAIETFEIVRKNAPNTVLFANMGAIQLNNGKSVKDYKKVVDMIQADGLYLHINPLQEAIQPGGDTNYKDLIAKITDLIARIDVPVFVKEVGHGIDEDTARLLFEAGAAAVDVAGLGGTSYGWVEAQRADNDYFARWFKNVGIPTDEAVALAAKHKGDSFVVASGGMRSPVAALKARALGADYYSTARSFLKRAVKSLEDTIDTVNLAQRGLQIAMFSCGVTNWEDAAKIKLMPPTRPTSYTDDLTFDYR